MSAGAAFGVNFKSRQIGRPIRYNKRFARDWRYCSLRSWIMTGDLFGADFAYHDVPNLYDPFDNEAYAANPMEFHLVCTDVMTGEAVYKQVRQGGDVCYDWVRASASMPMVSKPVHLDGIIIKNMVKMVGIEKENDEKKKLENDERQMFKLYEENDEIDEMDSEQLNNIAQIVLDRIQDKLSGTDFNSEIIYDVKNQVNELIKSATSYENLAQSYLGWCPFW